MQEFKALASELADAAGEIVKEHYRTEFDVVRKNDDSPVTIADRAIEKRMREMIEDVRPDDGVFGEEYGIKESKNGLIWVLDPIDGTKSFVIGRPTFGTLIALAEDDVPVLGVIDQAIAGERWVGVKGEETLFNGKPVNVSKCEDLNEARICSTTPAMFSGVGPVYEALPEGRMAWGGDCYMYGLMANGYVDVCVEASLSPYDFAALVPVVQGAGGVISDFNGNGLTLKSDGTVIAAATTKLRDQCADTIRSVLGS